MMELAVCSEMLFPIQISDFDTYSLLLFLVNKTRPTADTSEYIPYRTRKGMTFLCVIIQYISKTVNL